MGRAAPCPDGPPWRPLTRFQSFLDLLYPNRMCGSLVSKKVGLLATALACLVILEGCARVALVPSELPPEVYTLAAANTRAVTLDIRAPEEASVVGHQYMLVVVPFGQVRLMDPAGSLLNAVYVRAAERGYRPLLGTGNGAAATLSVRLVRVHATAFDAIFVRKIVCEVMLRAELRGKDGELLRQAEARGESSAWKEFAFAPQMNYVFNRALQKGVQKVLQDILPDYGA